MTRYYIYNGVRVDTFFPLLLSCLKSPYKITMKYCFDVTQNSINLGSHLRDPYFPLVNANQPIAHSRCKVTMLVLNPRILCQVSMPVVDPSVGALNA